MFQLVQRRLLKGTFSKFYVKNDYNAADAALYLANHSSWWDGLMLFELEQQKMIPNLHVMTDIEGMQRVPMFKWLGAYSVDASSPKHIMESLRYSEQLLNEQKNVCLFPQGMERHLEQRPLAFQQGAAMVINRISVPVVPVTFYYTFRDTKKAEAWVWIGAPISYEPGCKRAELTVIFEQAVTAQLDLLKAYVIENNHEPFTNRL